MRGIRPPSGPFSLRPDSAFGFAETPSVLDIVQAVEAVEGERETGALTPLVRFPDEKSLRTFRDSPENRSMKDLRYATATSNVALPFSAALRRDAPFRFVSTQDNT